MLLPHSRLAARPGPPARCLGPSYRLGEKRLRSALPIRASVSSTNHDKLREMIYAHVLFLSML